MKKEIVNLPASIRQRLLNEARESHRPFQELLQYFAMERFLYRLSCSPHSKTFVLKGALAQSAWYRSPFRPTKDIDLLGRVNNNIDQTVAIVQEICRQPVESDGIAFDPTKVVGERIAEDAEYKGVRVRFPGALGSARITMQIDIGFGDKIVPGPLEIVFPTILDLPSPRILGYSKETTIAEKFHAMARRGLLNSRIRDYFDIWMLSQKFDFDGRLLRRAIEETFRMRETPVPSEPIGLSLEFANDSNREAQWRGFLKRSKAQEIPVDFRIIVQSVHDFLVPIAAAVSEDLIFDCRWEAPGPWILIES